MSYQFLYETWADIAKKIATVGIGAFLTSSDTTAVTTSYVRLEGTFDNVEDEMFEINLSTERIKYNPVDGLTRTFTLTYTGDLSCPSNNDVATIGIEVTHDEVSTIVNGTEAHVTCRVGGSAYPFAKAYPLTLEANDEFEIQIKGDSSFTVTMNEFATTMTKFY